MAEARRFLLGDDQRLKWPPTAGGERKRGFVPRRHKLSARCHPAYSAFSPSQRTAVCKKTLNPYWGEEFKFEVADDSVLQNEPIEFKVMLLFWCGEA